MPTEPPTSASEAASANGSYDLFLSYNSVDREVVAAVRAHLQSHGVTAFLDRESLIPGQLWFDSIDEAIGRAKGVAVFVGRDGFGRWQKREMIVALDRQATAENSGRILPVIPILLPQADLERVSGFLLLSTWVDLRNGIGNVAALESLVGALKGNGQTKPKRPSEIPCPYRALNYFREEDAPLFFGREKFARDLLDKVLKQKLVAVVGASGSGKSSVVQAGLLPLLRRERQPAWDAITFTPHDQPFHSFAAAILPLLEPVMTEVDRDIEIKKLKKSWDHDFQEDGVVPVNSLIQRAIDKTPDVDRLLIVVDQFEELFTLSPEPLRKPFVAALLSASGELPVTIVLTLRADFYGQAISLDPDLTEAIQQGIVNIGPMRRNDLQEVIELPANKVGLGIESGLTNRILDHVEEQPGSLPLLEFALTKLFERRAGSLLTNQAYDDIGRIKGAISRHAEQEYEKLSPEQQRIALRLFTRLVRVASAGEEGTDTRQRVQLAELDDETRAVAKIFTDARLLVTSRREAEDEAILEVAHEALIQNWPELRGWLDDDREFLLWRQRLGLLLAEWQRMGEQLDLLLRGDLLKGALGFLRSREEDLSEQERSFIQQSVEASQDYAEQRKRRVLSVVSLAMLVVMGFTGWWLWTRSDAYQIMVIREGAPELIRSSSDSTITNWLLTEVIAERDIEAIAADRLEDVKYPLGLSKTWAVYDVFRPVDYQSEVYAKIVSALIKVGNVASSLVAADSIRNDDIRFEAYASIAVAFIKAGEREQAEAAMKLAMETVHHMKPDVVQSRAYTTIAEMFIDADILEPAEIALKWAKYAVSRMNEGNAGSRSAAYAWIAEAYIKAGKQQQAYALLDSAVAGANRIAFADSVYRAGSFWPSPNSALYKPNSALYDSAKAFLEVMEKFEPSIKLSAVYALIAKAYFKTGDVSTAKATVNRITHADDRLRTYTWIAEELTKAGKLKTAQISLGLAMLQTGSRYEHRISRVNESIIEAFIDSADFGSAMAAANAIVSVYARSRAYALIAEGFITASNRRLVQISLDSATDITNRKSIREYDSLAAAYATIAGVYLKASNLQEAQTFFDSAMAALHEGYNSESVYNRARGYLFIIDPLIKADALNQVQAPLDSARMLVRQLNHDSQLSLTYGMIAAVQAKLGLLREARMTAEQCKSSNDKLQAYMEIYREYIKRTDAEKAKALEELEEEFAGEFELSNDIVIQAYNDNYREYIKRTNAAKALEEREE